MSTSVLVLGWVLGMLLVAGLVVDGGQKIAATRRVEVAASGAARAASDATAASRLVGRFDSQAAVNAARTHLNLSGVEGTVSLQNGAVVVRTSARVPTIFLSLIGIDHLDAGATSSAELVRAG